MKKALLTFLFLLLSMPLWAATHWVSPTGTASWSASISATPLSGTACSSLSIAFANAGISGPDLVYLRGGTYALGTNPGWYFGYSGTADDDAHRIIWRAYTGETPNITATVGSASGNNKYAIWYNRNYHTWDGVSFHVGGFSGDINAIIGIEDTNATHLTIRNCHLHMTSQASSSNIDAIILGTGASYALVQNNDIEGPATGSGGGILTWDGPVGIKILNNNIHGFNIGLYVKHPNGDTSLSSGAEWAYNYIYNISGNGGLIGNPCYMRIHDNICVSSGGGNATTFGNGDNAGGHSEITHNTFKGLYTTTDNASMTSNVIKNNIMVNGCYTEQDIGTYTYNLYGSSGCEAGSNNITASPKFVGGTNPSTIAGFALASDSRGSLAYGEPGDDNKDRGANVALVGTGATGDTTAPAIAITSPTSSTTYDNGSTGTINISGTCSDDTAVTSVTWENAGNSTSGSATLDSSTTWSKTGITLVNGSGNIITVHAYDAAGNSASDTLTVTYTPADSTAPVVTITSPTSNATYDAGEATTIDIGGTSSDAVGVDHVTWANDRGGSGTCTGTTSWTKTGITLYNGTNVITVRSYDAANNSSTDTLTVTRIDPPPPNNAPVKPMVTSVQANDDDLTVGDTIIFKDELTSFDAYGDLNLWDAGSGIDTGFGHGGSATSAKAHFSASEVEALSFMLFFGRNAAGSSIRNTEDFTDVYCRMYLYHDSVTQNLIKVGRMSVFSAANWSQAAVGHLWGENGSTRLELDPVTSVSGSTVTASGWNDTSHFTWLGAQLGGTSYWSASYLDRWTCIEYHMKLNTPGSSDGVLEVWIDGAVVQDASITGLNFRGSYTGYGINSINFEAYINQGADDAKNRWFDHIVVSTAPIGLARSPLNPDIYKTLFSDSDTGDTQVSINAQVATAQSADTLVWDGTSSTTGNTINVNASNGTFSWLLAGQTMLTSNTKYYTRVRVYDGTDYSEWSDWYPLYTSADEVAPTAPSAVNCTIVNGLLR